jgi:ribosomal protein S18 acetylase RimI-like enzyme
MNEFHEYPITKANFEDLQEILNLQYLAYQSEAKLFNNPNIPPLMQTLSEIETEFETSVFLKVLNEDGNIIASVRAHSDAGTLYIGKLIVHPDLQGRGIGTKLLKEIENTCPHKRYELFTSTKSERNIKLYERAGYVKFKEQAIDSDLKFIFLCKIDN